MKGSSETLAGAIAKLSPPAGVLGAQAAGWNLPDYAALAALVYTVLMTCKLLWDWIIHPAIKRRAERRAEAARQQAELARDIELASRYPVTKD